MLADLRRKSALLAVGEIGLLLEDELCAERFGSLRQEQEKQLNFKFTPIQRDCMHQVLAATRDLQTCARNVPSSAYGQTAEETWAAVAEWLDAFKARMEDIQRISTLSHFQGTPAETALLYSLLHGHSRPLNRLTYQLN